MSAGIPLISGRDKGCAPAHSVQADSKAHTASYSMATEPQRAGRKATRSLPPNTEANHSCSRTYSDPCRLMAGCFNTQLIFKKIKIGIPHESRIAKNDFEKPENRLRYES
jgi:hypothetical protein